MKNFILDKMKCKRDGLSNEDIMTLLFFVGLITGSSSVLGFMKGAKRNKKGAMYKMKSL